MNCNWRKPLFILLCIVSVALIITGGSTTYWSKKEYVCDSKTVVLHYGVFNGCTNSACSTLHSDPKGHGVNWSFKVKALFISASVIGILAVFLNFLKLRWNDKIKAFLIPGLMLVAGSLALGEVGVYEELYWSYDVCKAITTGVLVDKHTVVGLKYGWSYIIACLGGILALCSFFFGLYTDFVDVFGTSENQFQSKRLDEVA